MEMGVNKEKVYSMVTVNAEVDGNDNMRETALIIFRLINVEKNVST